MILASIFSFVKIVPSTAENDENSLLLFHYVPYKILSHTMVSFWTELGTGGASVARDIMEGAVFIKDAEIMILFKCVPSRSNEKNSNEHTNPLNQFTSCNCHWNCIQQCTPQHGTWGGSPQSVPCICNVGGILGMGNWHWCEMRDVLSIQKLFLCWKSVLTVSPHWCNQGMWHHWALLILCSFEKPGRVTDPAARTTSCTCPTCHRKSGSSQRFLAC